MPAPDLVTAELTLSGRLTTASNATFLGSIGGSAVAYNPIASEKPFWDFPDGCPAHREVAAYLEVTVMSAPNPVILTAMQKRETGFIAQYDSGTCTGCGASIETGQEIAISWSGRVTRYHHIEPCPGASPITCSICGDNWWECACP